MSAVATEATVADPAGGVENRMWKWRGYDIRYKVAAEVSKPRTVSYRLASSQQPALLHSYESAQSEQRLHE